MSETRNQSTFTDAQTVIIYGKKVADDSTGYPIFVGANGQMRTNDYSNDIECGGKVSVGTTAVEVTFTGVTSAILISADFANTGVLYVGKSTVTSSGTNAFTFLQAGESLSIDFDDSSSAIYVVASVASQNFYKGATL